MSIPTCSEAMRLGAMMKPQGIGAALHEGKTCALGAAADAIGALNGVEKALDIEPRTLPWPWIYDGAGVECPECGGRCVNALNVIVHLNDWHKWTRERIADFIATIEPQETQTPQAVALLAEPSHATRA